MSDNTRYESARARGLFSRAASAAARFRARLFDREREHQECSRRIVRERPSAPSPDSALPSASRTPQQLSALNLTHLEVRSPRVSAIRPCSSVSPRPFPRPLPALHLPPTFQNLTNFLACRPSPPQSLRGQDVIITLSDESTRQGTVHNVDPINFTVALLKVRPSARRRRFAPTLPWKWRRRKRRRSCGGTRPTARPKLAPTADPSPDAPVSPASPATPSADRGIQRCVPSNPARSPAPRARRALPSNRRPWAPRAPPRRAAHRTRVIGSSPNIPRIHRF